MKIFKDLYIKASDSDLVEFIDKVSAHILPPWKRLSEKEIDFNFLTDDDMFYFERDMAKGLPSVGLTILKKEDHLWYIPNIVPLESGSLSYDQYNEILDEFYSICLSHISEKQNIKLERTLGETSDVDVLGEKGAKLLKTFSSCANKSTGSSHPLDQKRWLSFIVNVTQTQKDIDIDYLERILLEQGWSEEIASKLIIEFEFAQNLIEFMEQH